MSDLISLFTILIGLTVLGVVIYFSHHLKKRLRLLDSLVRMEVDDTLDIKEYISQIALKLKEIGIYAINYDLAYSHSRIHQEEPIDKSLSSQAKEIHERNVKGHITILIKSNKGEDRILNQLVLEFISMSILYRIQLKIESANESFRRVSILQTYMTHDLKNVLQFIQSMQYNLANLESDDESIAYVKHLQKTTTTLDRRVDSMLRLLKSPNAQESSERCALHTMVRSFLDYYKLEGHIQGEAILEAPKNLLESLFLNIFANIAQKSYDSAKITSFVEIEEDDSTIELLIKDDGEPFENPQEVCEAFYTTKESGMGIGMYQSASIMKALSGKIECYNDKGHPVVKLIFYKKREL